MKRGRTLDMIIFLDKFKEPSSVLDDNLMTACNSGKSPTTRIIIIFETGDPQLIAYYRPIGLLSQQLSLTDWQLSTGYW